METKLKTPKSVILFSNGNTVCFDGKGQTIDELQQKGWLAVYFEWLESKGINPMEIEKIETAVNGRYVYLKPFKIDGEWNAHVVTKLEGDCVSEIRSDNC